MSDRSYLVARAKRINVLLLVIRWYATPTWCTSSFYGPDLPKLPNEDDFFRDWKVIVQPAVEVGLFKEGEYEKLEHASAYWWQQPLVARAAILELMDALKPVAMLPGEVGEVAQLRRTM